MVLDNCGAGIIPKKGFVFSKLSRPLKGKQEAIVAFITKHLRFAAFPCSLILIALLSGSSNMIMHSVVLFTVLGRKNGREYGLGNRRKVKVLKMCFDLITI